MCSWGAGLGVLAPCFFGSTQRTIVLDRLIPTPQTPGSCWWAEGTDRSPRDTPRQSPSLVLWWVHPWARGPILSSSPRSRNRDSEESVPSKEKAFGDLSNCADISEAHAAPPALSLCPGPHMRSSQNWSFPLGCQCNCGPRLWQAQLQDSGTQKHFVASPLPPPHPGGQQRWGPPREITALVQGGRQGCRGMERHVTSTETRPKYKLSRGKEEGQRVAGNKKRGRRQGVLGEGGLTPPHR